LVRDRDARTATPLFRLVDRAAEVAQELRDVLLFVRLRGVVRGPFLPVGDAKRFGHGAALGRRLTVERELDGVDVLAAVASLLEVRAGAFGRRRIDDVGSASALRRDDPKVTLAPQLLGSRDF
jgi:hypothetical protein